MVIPYRNEAPCYLSFTYKLSQLQYYGSLVHGRNNFLVKINILLIVSCMKDQYIIFKE